MVRGLRSQVRRRLAKAYFGGRLRPLDPTPIPRNPSEIRLFMVVRNAALRIPYLFRYYSELGVDRFFVIDNGSTDETVAILRRHDSTHVFSTTDRYSVTECGVVWVESLMDRHARNQWCVIVDSDELLAYPHYETVSLKHLCQFLDREGATALHSFLLDMYSDRPIAETIYAQGVPFLEACRYFETGHRSRRPDGYWEGGVRRRVFGARNILSKHNLVKYVAGTTILGGTHSLAGGRLSAVTGVTLHFKYFHDFAGQARLEAERGEHWNAGWQYKRYAEAVDKTPDLTLFYEGSVPYQGSRQLTELGLMTSTPEFDEFASLLEPRWGHKD